MRREYIFDLKYNIRWYPDGVNHRERHQLESESHVHHNGRQSRGELLTFVRTSVRPLNRFSVQDDGWVSVVIRLVCRASETP